MSGEVACECDGMPPHSHIYAYELRDEPALTMVAAQPVSTRKMLVSFDTGEVRIWVDWKAVAHELIAPPPVSAGVGSKEQQK